VAFVATARIPVYFRTAYYNVVSIRTIHKLNEKSDQTKANFCIVSTVNNATTKNHNAENGNMRKWP
jgi:hypothetical protein